MQKCVYMKQVTINEGLISSAITVYIEKFIYILLCNFEFVTIISV